ncbi:MAG: WD40 repeat domain-containing serine/threonine protein kinase, partial [Gemmataceae bacterium]
AESYLPLLPRDADFLQAAMDVVYGEYLMEEQKGTGPDTEKYFQRFPDLKELLNRQIELHRGLFSPDLSVPLVSSILANQSEGILPTTGTEGGQTPSTIPGYELIEPIGKGGMSVVYRARQMSLHRIVALKLLEIHTGKEPTMLDRVRREAQITAQLSHPNIVTVYDAGLVGSTFYLAMEFLDGTDLHRMVEEKGPLPIGMAVDYLRQAVQGLHHAHQQGLVHRDIKPGNLMVIHRPGDGGYGQLKLLDMGLARMVVNSLDSKDNPPLTQFGAFLGTPDFIAPEQASDPRQADIRSDLYSLGCSFYFILTGQLPFGGQTAMAKILHHHLHQPRPITEIRPDISAPLAKLINRMIAKLPSERFQTPEEMLQEIRALPESRTAPLSSDGQDLTFSLVRFSRQWQAHENRVNSLAFSADGKLLASAGLDPQIRLWNIPGGNQTHEWAFRGSGVSSLVFAGGSDRIISGNSDGQLSAWNKESPRPIWRYFSVGQGVEGLAVHAETNTLLLGLRNGSLEVRNLDSGISIQSWVAHQGPITCLSLSQRDRKVLTGGKDRMFRLWDGKTGDLLQEFPEQAMLVTAVALSDDGTRAYVAGVDGIIHVWDTKQKTAIRSLEGHDGRITSLALSPDGRLLASASRDKTARVWDIHADSACSVLSNHSGWVTSVAWNPDGKWLATGSLDRTICLYSVRE